jgi:enamidase
VVTSGEPRFVGRSRNTPAPIKNIRVIESRIPRDFSLGHH